MLDKEAMSIAQDARRVFNIYMFIVSFNRRIFIMFVVGRANICIIIIRRNGGDFYD